MNAPTAPYLKTLVECHKKMMEDGYREDFVIEDMLLKCLDTGKKYIPQEIAIVNFFRFEGQTDPGDSSIMYVLETQDGKKGTMIDSYGVYSDPEISAFIGLVENIQKKV